MLKTMLHIRCLKTNYSIEIIVGSYICDRNIWKISIRFAPLSQLQCLCELHPSTIYVYHFQNPSKKSTPTTSKLASYTLKLGNYFNTNYSNGTKQASSCYLLVCRETRLPKVSPGTILQGCCCCILGWAPPKSIVIGLKTSKQARLPCNLL